VHKRDCSYPIAHPSTASKTLNLVLFDVQSDILSENWSHFCSTRPIEPTERAGLDEPQGVCLESTGPALAPPPPAAGEDAPARVQGRATDAGLSNGCSGSNNGRSGSFSGSSNGRSGSCNGRRSAQGPRAGPRIAALGADNDPSCDGGAAGDLRPSSRPGRRSPPAPLHTAHAAPADSRRMVGTGQIRSAPSSEDLLCRSTNASRRPRPPPLPQ